MVGPARRAGALNDGHNHPVLKQRVIDYLERDGVVHSLDMYTEAKHRLLTVLYETILGPRGLGHLKVAFPAPTGTNAVEMALKVARRAAAVAGIASEHGAALIVDDVQAGCGRTGSFFSFERAGIAPDMICLSKSLSGLGLPLSVLLLHPRLDVLRPGEHSGTFRGHDLAFVSAAAALELWDDDEFAKSARRTGDLLGAGLRELIASSAGAGAQLRGRGAMLGIGWQDPAIASRVSAAAFRHGLIAETCGSVDEVLKLYPPLTITESELAAGLDRLAAAILEAC